MTDSPVLRTPKTGDCPYFQMPQHLIDKAVEIRRWFTKHGYTNWTIAGIGPVPETPDREQLLQFAKTILSGTTKDGLYNGRSPDELWSEIFPMTDRPSGRDETL